jgi:hypothetical protein
VLQRAFGRLVLVVAIVLGLYFVITHYHGIAGCDAAGAGVAHADSGGCPTTVQGLAEDVSWAGQRIQSLAGQPETVGKLYSPGLVSGFQARTFNSGYNADATRADQAIADAGIVPAGRSLNVAAHVEVQAAAFMRAQGITYAVLVINKLGGVCGVETVDQPFTCNAVIPGILPKGSILAVWSPVEVHGQRKSLKFEGVAAQ